MSEEAAIVRSPAAMLFANQGLHGNAEFIAGLHPRAIDYLGQAPVLALCFGAKANTRADRLYVAMRIGGPISRGERLRNVMAAVGIAYPLRKLCANILNPSDQPMIRKLGALNPSSLAQIIPETPGAQKKLLAGLKRWTARLERLSSSPTLHTEWIARQVSLSGAEPNEVEDAADFFLYNRVVDLDRWTWERLTAEVALWHDRLAMERDLQRLPDAIQMDTRIDLSAWPDHAEIGGMEVFKLATPGMIMEEGRRMRHCVASYIPHVMNGQCSIFSMRAGMRRVATLEVVGKRIAQLKCFANKQPNKDIRAAAAKFIADMSTMTASP